MRVTVIEFLNVDEADDFFLKWDYIGKPINDVQTTVRGTHLIFTIKYQLKW